MTDAVTTALDKYERILDKSYSQVIDDRLDNLGHCLTVIAYNQDGSLRWEECCLDADEFHQAMHEVIRDGLRYDITRSSRN